MTRLRNDFVAVGGDRAANLGEVLKLVATFRIPDASRRGCGLRLSAVEVRALDWAIIRDSTVPNSEDHWLDAACDDHIARDAYRRP
jgi:hypothetical protein